MKNIALLIAATLLMAPALAGEVPGGMTPSGPVVCDGDDLTLTNRYIETDGNGVEAHGNCDLQIVNCKIVAGGIAVLAEGNGEIDIRGSHIEGGRAGLVAEGNGEIYYTRSTILGGTSKSKFAEIVDRGGSTVGGAASSSASSVSIGGDTIQIGGPGGVTIDTGPGGTVVHDAGSASTVSSGPNGVTVDTPDANVVVAGDYVKIDSGGATTTITGDWRGVHSVYSDRDVDTVMTDLGAVSIGDEILIDLAGDILFDFGSDAIRAAAEAHLGMLAQLLRDRAAEKVYVIGHTDSVGEDAYNQKLSERRAVSVMRWLNENEGIPTQIMFGQGMGERKPIAHNNHPDGSDDPEGRARNRRVEVRFDVR